MSVVQVITDLDRTIATAGQALLDHLEAKGRARSHIESVESHLCVHLVPFFEDRPIDRIDDGQVSRLLVRLRRSGRAPKTIRNIVSTLHSVFELARRRRWVDANPCTLIDLPASKPNTDIRFLTYDERRGRRSRHLSGRGARDRSRACSGVSGPLQ